MAEAVVVVKVAAVMAKEGMVVEATSEVVVAAEEKPGLEAAVRTSAAGLAAREAAARTPVAGGHRPSHNHRTLVIANCDSGGTPAIETHMPD